tara:strand:+ start:593 stop:3007 length:2415 start_codon:yes stop_codon:yes gene_type:complete
MSSSYFESLGRKESEPFTYDELNYAETEPDLVEATNKQIDENIKDRKQFFQDNITLYNMTMEARSKRWSDLAKLTKSGKEILDRRRTYKESENKWDGWVVAYEDENTRSEFISNAILYENENKEIKVEGSKEVGTMLRTGESSDGVPMKPTDIADFNLVIQAGDFDNGLQAINEMNAHLPVYMKIAENSLMVNGKLYKDMTYSEKQHWRKIAYARYAEMWMAEHPEITERQIISKFVGNVKGVERDWDGTASDIHKDATNEIATGYQTVGVINSLKAASANFYNGNENAVVHSLFSQDSYIQERVAYYEGLGLENPYKLANDDFVKLIIDNIGSFNENDLRYLTKEHKFVPEGQKGEKTYDDIQDQNVSKINNAWNKQKKKESKEFLENELNALEIQVNEGDYVTIDQLKDYLAHPDLAQRANALLDQSNKRRAILNQPEFETQRGILLRSIETYVLNNFAESKDYNWRYAKEGAILDKAKALFAVKLKEYQNTNQDNAGALAMQDVLNELNGGTWDNVNTAVYVNGDRGTDLINARTAYNTDFNKTLNTKEVHTWEQPYIKNAIEFFKRDSNVELDGYWTQIAKDHSGVSPFKLAHDRLVTLGYIEPNPNFGVRLNMPENDTKLLITKTDFAKINRVMLSSDENMNEVLNSLIDPKVNDNGGIDAIKVNNKYQPLNEEVKLSEMTVGEILDKVRSGEISRDTELGIYGLKGDAFIDLALHANLDLNRTFDQDTQTLVLLERLRYKSNNKLQFRDSDFTYRRLVNVPEEDREEFKSIIGDLGPFMDLNTLLPAAANELVQTNMN